MRRGIADLFGHRTRSAGVAIGALPQVFENIIHRPAALPDTLIAGYFGPEPALQRVTLQAPPVFITGEKVLRRVAGAAMAEAFHQITAPIPLRRPLRPV